MATSAASGSPVAEPPPGVDVETAGLIDPQTGWAVTQAGLVISGDGGKGWSTITPGGLTARDIVTVQFQDPRRGWLVGVQGSTQAFLYRTSDGGHTWARGELQGAEPFQQRVQAAWIDVVGSHGWVMLSRGDTSQTHIPSLFTTVDGGASFTRVAAPAAVPVRFLNDYVGFTVGGSAAGIYVTHDGGLSWQPQALPKPEGREADVFSSSAVVDPQARVSARVVLQLDTPSFGVHDAVAVYRVNPPGTEWSLESSRGMVNASSSLVVSLPSATEVVLGETESTGGLFLSTSRDDGGHFADAVSHVAPSMVTASFATASAGWVVVEYSGCRSGKSDCFDERRLVATEDGGASYRVLSPQA